MEKICNEKNNIEKNNIETSDLIKDLKDHITRLEYKVDKLEDIIISLKLSKCTNIKSKLPHYRGLC